MQCSGSLSQSMSQRNISHDIQPCSRGKKKKERRRGRGRGRRRKRKKKKKKKKKEKERKGKEKKKEKEKERKKRRKRHKLRNAKMHIFYANHSANSKQSGSRHSLRSCFNSSSWHFYLFLLPSLFSSPLRLCLRLLLLIIVVALLPLLLLLRLLLFA